MKRRTVAVAVIAALIVVVAALLLSRCSPGSSGSASVVSSSGSGSESGSSTSIASSEPATSTSGAGQPATSVSSPPTMYAFDDSMSKACHAAWKQDGGAKVNTDGDPNATHQHWVGSGLQGCATITIMIGNYQSQKFCAKAAFPVVNGVFDGYLDVDPKTCGSSAATTVDVK